MNVRLQQIESSLRIDNRDGTFVLVNTSGVDHNTRGVIDVKVIERKVDEVGKKMEQEMKETKDMVKTLIDII